MSTRSITKGENRGPSLLPHTITVAQRMRAHHADELGVSKPRPEPCVSVRKCRSVRFTTTINGVTCDDVGEGRRPKTIKGAI
jgi:hypothetical protein